MLKLVYGCLAFSAISLAFLIVVGVKQGDPFRGTTKAMSDAITQNAQVLAADASGAVTQSGNGHITGYRFGDTRVWGDSFNPFEEGPANPHGAGSIDALANCAGACPSAITELLGTFSARGGASGELAATLTALGRDGASLLRVVDRAGAFAGGADPNTPAPLRSIDRGSSMTLPITNPSVVEVSSDRRRALVGSAAGRRGAITRLEMRGRRWSTRGPAIIQRGLMNSCISGDGRWIGMVAGRASRRSFDGGARVTAGPRIATGMCSVDALGMTLSFTTVGRTDLVAARYDADGREVWRHTLGAMRLLSGSGSPHVVAQSSDGNVVALDAVSGRELFSHSVDGEPFVATDGSIVTADRSGRPTWLLRGRASAP